MLSQLLKKVNIDISFSVFLRDAFFKGAAIIDNKYSFMHFTHFILSAAALCFNRSNLLTTTPQDVPP
jgi:uncharacterized membrane protein YozB (DUF420 family)